MRVEGTEIRWGCSRRGVEKLQELESRSSIFQIRLRWVHGLRVLFSTRLLPVRPSATVIAEHC